MYETQHKFITAEDIMLEINPHSVYATTTQYEIEGKLHDPAHQTDAIRELVKLIALIDDELKRSLYIKSISKKFNLREKLIESDLNKFHHQQQLLKQRSAAKQYKTPIKKTLICSRVFFILCFINYSFYTKHV